MKKFGKIIAVTAAAACVAGAVAGLAACSGGSADIENTYVFSEMEDNAYNGGNYIVYNLNLMSDGTYELVKTVYTNGYGMNLGTYGYQTFGTYTAGISADGYTPYTLSEATRVIVNAYSDMGGFNISIDTETATYPVELPAETEGEKNMAQSKEDVVKAYGAEMTVYIGDNNKFQLTNPNA